MRVSLLEQPGGSPMIERLNVTQFHRMIQLGILREGEPIELIDGLLMRKNRGDRGGDWMVTGPRHSLCVKRLQRLVDPQLNRFGCHLHCQHPLAVSDHSEPEPDAAVVRGVPEDYAERHPGPDDVPAVIEVADSSLEYDRSTKQQIYASAGIPVYWIVNLRSDTVEVYEEPSPELAEYRVRRDVRKGETVRLELGEGQCLELALGDLIP